MTAATFDGYVYAAITVPSGVTISATSNAGGPTTVTITAGSYQSISTLRSQVATDLDSQRPITGGSWQAGFTAGTTGLVTLQTSNASSFSITWTSTDLRNILGFTADISSQTSVTASSQAKGYWQADCPLVVETGVSRAAPRVTDAHQTESPNGLVITHVGNVKYRHRGLSWSHCPKHKIWIIEEGTPNESLEQFMIDTQWGQGHSWFSPGAKLRVTTTDGYNLGHTTVAGWYLKGARSMDSIVKRADPVWDGLWGVTWQELTTDS